MAQAQRDARARLVARGARKAATTDPKELMPWTSYNLSGKNFLVDPELQQRIQRCEPSGFPIILRNDAGVPLFSKLHLSSKYWKVYVLAENKNYMLVHADDSGLWVSFEEGKTDELLTPPLTFNTVKANYDWVRSLGHGNNDYQLLQTFEDAKVLLDMLEGGALPGDPPGLPMPVHQPVVPAPALLPGPVVLPQPAPPPVAQLGQPGGQGPPHVPQQFQHLPRPICDPGNASAVLAVVRLLDRCAGLPIREHSCPVPDCATCALGRLLQDVHKAAPGACDPATVLKALQADRPDRPSCWAQPLTALQELLSTRLSTAVSTTVRSLVGVVLVRGQGCQAHAVGADYKEEVHNTLPCPVPAPHEGRQYTSQEYVSMHHLLQQLNKRCRRCGQPLIEQAVFVDPRSFVCLQLKPGDVALPKLHLPVHGGRKMGYTLIGGITHIAEGNFASKFVLPGSNICVVFANAKVTQVSLEALTEERRYVLVLYKRSNWLHDEQLGERAVVAVGQGEDIAGPSQPQGAKAAGAPSAAAGAGSSSAAQAPGQVHQGRVSSSDVLIQGVQNMQLGSLSHLPATLPAQAGPPPALIQLPLQPQVQPAASDAATPPGAVLQVPQVPPPILPANQAERMARARAWAREQQRGAAESSGIGVHAQAQAIPLRGLESSPSASTVSDAATPVPRPQVSQNMPVGGGRAAGRGSGQQAGGAVPYSSDDDEDEQRSQGSRQDSCGSG